MGKPKKQSGWYLIESAVRHLCYPMGGGYYLNRSKEATELIAYLSMLGHQKGIFLTTTNNRLFSLRLNEIKTLAKKIGDAKAYEGETPAMCVELNRKIEELRLMFFTTRKEQFRLLKTV